MNNSTIIPVRKKYPQIYAYSIEEIYPGCIKVGYTTRQNVRDRINEQFKIEFPDNTKPYRLLHYEDAFDNNGNSFDDHAIHKYLENKGFERVGGEWFRCTIEDVQAALVAVKNGISNEENRTQTFGMRPEQQEAVNKTAEYYNFCDQNNIQKAHFLWNCKMRFGKTFASYQLAKKQGYRRILITTYKPAVHASWEEDLNNHIDFEGYQFISRNTELKYNDCDKDKPIVCFMSFQDLLGKTEDGDIKDKNKWLYDIQWDIVIIDEYHFGAWREAAKDHLDDYVYTEPEEGIEAIKVKTNHYLFLSGTPFRALNNGEFEEEQVYNWTYSDEQKAKNEWKGDDNPYSSLPELVMMTYKLPSEIASSSVLEDTNEFDLTEFFKARYTNTEKTEAEFIHESDVQKWLNFITGIDIEKVKGEYTVPFELETHVNLQHTVWFLPDVASCYAMKKLLQNSSNKHMHKYKVVVAAGNECGCGVEAKIPVDKAIGKNPLETMSITLTCGKLTTGVTVKPWSAIFMLRNLNSPETYFQAAFRVQSPWTVKDEDGNVTNLKEQCFVFDFAPNRALRQISDYCVKANAKKSDPIDKVVDEFIKYLPILAYENMKMQRIDAADLLDMAMGKTAAGILAKGWKDNSLICINDKVLTELVNNDEAMNILMSIDSFRKSHDEIQTIVNKTEEIKKLESKKEKAESKKEKKEIDKKINSEKKKVESLKEQLRQKLKAFIAKLPLFMLLSDDRESSLKEIIETKDPKLFKIITGISSSEFDTLRNTGIFNSVVMNNAVYHFKKNEESSLCYLGINKHEEDIYVGGYDEQIAKEEYEEKRIENLNSLQEIKDNIDNVLREVNPIIQNPIESPIELKPIVEITEPEEKHNGSLFNKIKNSLGGWFK